MELCIHEMKGRRRHAHLQCMRAATCKIHKLYNKLMLLYQKAVFALKNVVQKRAALCKRLEEKSYVESLKIAWFYFGLE